MIKQQQQQQQQQKQARNRQEDYSRPCSSSLLGVCVLVLKSCINLVVIFYFSSGLIDVFIILSLYFLIS